MLDSIAKEKRASRGAGWRGGAGVRRLMAKVMKNFYFFVDPFLLYIYLR